MVNITAPSDFGNDIDTFDDAVKHLRGINERLFDGWRSAANSMVDLYSQGIANMINLRATLIEDQLEWMSAASRVQTAYARQANSTGTRLTHEILG